MTQQYSELCVRMEKMVDGNIYNILLTTTLQNHEFHVFYFTRNMFSKLQNVLFVSQYPLNDL